METIREIKVFLSCPGDLKDILPVVDKFLNYENIDLTKNHNIRLELKHWKKNIYPGKGDPRVQDSINEQLVFCDIYVGILWTRFGMPPGVRLDGKKYGSGTEEEFFAAKDLEKELWFFFCDRKIKPSKIEPEQLMKVNEFRKRLQEQHILYLDFEEIEELERKLKFNLSEWIYKQNQIPKEDVAQDTHMPTNEDFKEFNKGF
jgi:hypothetical protein